MSELLRQGTRQMRENCKREMPWFAGMPGHRGRLVLVAGGPSLRENMGYVKVRQRAGAKVLACNAAGKLLQQNGITPDMIAFVDPNAVVAGFLNDPPIAAHYLVASVCHPSVLDALAAQKVTLWHADNGDPEQKEILDAYPERPSALVGGGNTVALRSMVLGYLLGFRAFDLYGMDSSYAADGADHAYTKHDGPEPNVATTFMDGSRYRCAPWMIKQAEDFRFWYAKLRGMGVKIHVHGEGLIPDMARKMNQIVRERIAA